MSSDASTRIKRGFVEIDHGQLHYRYLGESGPPMLFLHQVSSSSRMFGQLMPRFVARGYRALALDLPGLGDSDPPPRYYSIPDYAACVARFLDAIGVNEPSVVLGHHTGALVAAELAAAHPDRVRRLVLIGLPYFVDPQAQRARWTALNHRGITPEPDAGHLLYQWERLRKLSPEIATDLLHRELVDTLKAPRYDLTYHAVYHHDARQSVPAIACPTLVIAGTKDGLYGIQASAAAAIPGAKLVEIEGGGTFMCDEKADEVAAAVLAFLGAG